LEGDIAFRKYLERFREEDYRDVAHVEAPRRPIKDGEETPHDLSYKDAIAGEPGHHTGYGDQKPWA
jgi:hypothetical protein